MQITYPTRPKDRFEVYRFFNGLASEGKDGLDRRRSRVPLVKSYLLEHMSPCCGRTLRQPGDILKSMGAEVQPVDDTFMEVRDYDSGTGATAPSPRTVGYMEQLSERFFAYYTCDKSDVATRRVNHWITRSPDLDSTWFSSQLLQRLWDSDVSQRGDERFSKLTFLHESIFEMPEDAADPTGPESDEDGDEGGQENDSDDQPDFERRKARFNMADRIGRIKSALGNLQANYAPLHALYALRFPSRIGRGSHDLYQQGRITNRSESFEEHRNIVRYLYKTYDAMLTHTEETAWHRMESVPSGLRTNIGAKGVPLVIEFKEEISAATFRHWVSRAFQKRNRFRLWGEPIWMGPTKVHVYGADRHLWQPINIEMTEKSLIAFLPQGTCGNTFHRLVTNIQAYVCPSIDAWLGGEPFQGLVDSSIAQSGGYINEGFAFWREKEPELVRLEDGTLKVQYRSAAQQAAFLDWLEDYQRTDFSTATPPLEEPLPLLDMMMEERRPSVAAGNGLETLGSRWDWE